MCGFSGFFNRVSFPQYPEQLLMNMGQAIFHRGPDDGGVWCDEVAGIGLSHRRLAIIDLSAAGHQPMVSASGRFVMVFNGEIYNHLTLRKRLESLNEMSCWRGHSDTETLLAAITAWGVSKALQASVGMFALALWDREKRTLTLARDRLGEKPLYYGWQGESFLFGSELKALRAHPHFAGEINRDALTLLMRHSYVPAPHSIWQGIYKLQPGCLLTLSSGRHEPTIEHYWSGQACIESGLAKPFSGDAGQAVSTLDALLHDAIGQQMMADVPLGAFLSGGVDSSLIVALMQAQSCRPVRTFTIGFDEVQYNEAKHARAVARHLKTDHTELYVTSREALSVIPKLPVLFDEPFSDASQIPTFLVSEMARQYVAVSLSGDGGDELFGGYNRYVFANRLWGRLSKLPLALRTSLAKGLTAISPQGWNRLAYPFTVALGPINVGDKLYKGADVLASSSVDAMHLQLVSHWSDPTKLVKGAIEPETLLTGTTKQPVTLSGVEQMMALDMLSYLPDDILVKVDRAAMGVSLETRVPFLDHRVVEFAWSLPLQFKLSAGVGKWVLRQVLYQYVPPALIERPKMGFAVPIGSWLRGPLRDWAEELLNENRLEQEGFFDSAMVRSKLAEHLSRKRNWQYHLWDVLMFQAWWQAQ